LKCWRQKSVSSKCYATSWLCWNYKPRSWQPRRGLCEKSWKPRSTGLQSR